MKKKNMIMFLCGVILFLLCFTLGIREDINERSLSKKRMLTILSLPTLAVGEYMTDESTWLESNGITLSVNHNKWHPTQAKFLLWGEIEYAAYVPPNFNIIKNARQRYLLADVKDKEKIVSDVKKLFSSDVGNEDARKLIEKYR
jgi:hypothetical protein